MTGETPEAQSHLSKQPFWRHPACPHRAQGVQDTKASRTSSTAAPPRMPSEFRQVTSSFLHRTSCLLGHPTQCSSPRTEFPESWDPLCLFRSNAPSCSHGAQCKAGSPQISPNRRRNKWLHKQPCPSMERPFPQLTERLWVAHPATPERPSCSLASTTHTCRLEGSGFLLFCPRGIHCGCWCYLTVTTSRAHWM